MVGIETFLCMRLHDNFQSSIMKLYDNTEMESTFTNFLSEGITGMPLFRSMACSICPLIHSLRSPGNGGISKKYRQKAFLAIQFLRQGVYYLTAFQITLSSNKSRYPLVLHPTAHKMGFVLCIAKRRAWVEGFIQSFASKTTF